MADEQPIIIIKKKGGHGGHHGGAWKVAYADFVTAMMSLFIVLWLMNSTPKPVQEEIAGYFNDPKGTATKKGSDGKPIPKETKESKEAKAAKDEKKAMDDLKNQLLRAIDDLNLLNKLKKQIEITATDEGLRIELVEDEKGTFFEEGSAQPTPALQQILKVISDRLKTVPNRLSIEGHTDAHPYANAAAYGNWELSTDRANVARRDMQEDGVRPDQVLQVRGFADQQLHFPDKPLDPANRRVSLVVLNLPTGAPGKTSEKPSSEAKPKTAIAEGKPAEGKPAEGKPAEGKSVEAVAAATPAVAPATGTKEPVPAAQKGPAGMLAGIKGLFGKKAQAHP